MNFLTSLGKSKKNMDFNYNIREVYRSLERLDTTLDQSVVKATALKKEIEGTRQLLAIYGMKIMNYSHLIRPIFISSLLSHDDYLSAGIIMTFICTLTSDKKFWDDLQKDISETHWKCYACNSPVCILTMDKCYINMTHLVLCTVCTGEPVIRESITLTA
jgi:hypothetical protein